MLKKLPDHQYQRGIADFKKLILFAGGGFILFIVVIIATAPAPKSQETQSGQNANASGQPATPQPSPTPAENDGKPKEAVVKLPADFRRFTSKQYNFSLAYPESWGSPITQPTPSGSTLYAVTKDVNYPLSTAALVGKLSIAIYKNDLFKIAINPGNPIIQPAKKDGKTTWKIISVAADEPEYRVGNTYKVESRSNPSGLTIYDFTWANTNGQREGRWVFEAKDTYILMSLPAVTSTNGAASPSGTELSFYSAFVNQVIDSVTIPQ